MSSPPRSEKQYTYFLDRATDWGEVWLLGNGERWIAGSDDDGRRDLFYAWPHASYATDSAQGEWAGFEPEALEVREFIVLCGRLEQDEVTAALMRTTDGEYITITPDILAHDLRSYLGQIE